MAQMIIALITPRAGKWNHRYIIPSGKNWNDAQLAKALQILESSQGERYGIVKSEPVRQQGGREGTEKLFFYCDGFESLDSATQEQCKKKMELWFTNQRNSMIAKVNWSAEGQKQAIQRTEMDELYREIEPLTASVCPPEKEAERPKSSCCLKGCCAMFAVAVGVSLAFFWDQFTNLPWWPSQPSVTEQENKGETDKYAPYKELFVCSCSEEPDEGELLEIFNKLWKTRGKDELKNLSGYTEENDEIGELLQKKNNNEDPLFLSDDEGGWDVLNGIAPQKFHYLIKTIEDTGWTFDDKPDCPLMEGDVDTIFYYSKEREYAEALRDWLVKEAKMESSPELKTVIREIVNNSTFKDRILTEYKARYRPEGTSKSEDKLKNLAEDFIKELEKLLEPTTCNDH